MAVHSLFMVMMGGVLALSLNKLEREGTSNARTMLSKVLAPFILLAYYIKKVSGVCGTMFAFM